MPDQPRARRLGDGHSCPMRKARHRFEAHTGEVRFLLEAPDLPALFREAGRALAEVMAPGAETGPAGPEEEVEVRGRDRAALLVDWLDELIYRVDTTGRIYTDLSIDRLDETSLRARIRGHVPPAFKTAVKAATFHGLQVEEDGDGFTAAVVLDV